MQLPCGHSLCHDCWQGNPSGNPSANASANPNANPSGALSQSPARDTDCGTPAKKTMRAWSALVFASGALLALGICLLARVDLLAYLARAQEITIDIWLVIGLTSALVIFLPADWEITANSDRHGSDSDD